MSNSNIEEVRKREFERPAERELYLHLGHFFAWYNAAEFSLTLTIAMMLRESDLAAFHALTKGLDARSKIRRLKQICKIKKRAIGPNLTERLTYFHDTICEFRNTVSHNAIAIGEEGTNFYISAIDRMPWRELGFDTTDEPPAKAIKRLTVFEYGSFLNDFTFDLIAVNRLAAAGQPLEIDHPRSQLPEAHPSNSPAPDPQTKPDKPAQTDSETPG